MFCLSFFPASSSFLDQHKILELILNSLFCKNIFNTYPTYFMYLCLWQSKCYFMIVFAFIRIVILSFFPWVTLFAFLYLNVERWSWSSIYSWVGNSPTKCTSIHYSGVAMFSQFWCRVQHRIFGMGLMILILNCSCKLLNCTS